MTKQLNDHINVAIRENEKIVTDWPLSDLAKELYLWTDIFNITFFKEHPVPVPTISFEKSKVGSLGHYVIGRNGFGVRENININRVHLDRPMWDILATLLHEMVHSWQGTYGNPSNSWFHNREFRLKMAELGILVNEKGCHVAVGDQFVSLLREHGVKVSMRSLLMLPRLAVIDPQLTLSMPPPITAFTGLDALTQLMEAFVSNKANPLTDGICREGMGRAARSLRTAFEDGKDQAAREDMAVASLFGGLALANAKLGAVHGFAGPLGGMFSAPHGAICGLLLPHVMEANVHALKTRTPGSPALARYEEVAQILTGVFTARAADAVKWVQDLCGIFEVPPLSAYDLKEKDFPGVVTKVGRASSTKGNPIVLTDDELMQILEKAF